MRRFPVGLTLLAVPAALALLAPETAEAQCAMCRTALEQNPDAAAGFNRAILFLLLMPYAVFGALTAFYLRTRRRAADAPAATPVPAPARLSAAIPVGHAVPAGAPPPE